MNFARVFFWKRHLKILPAEIRDPFWFPFLIVVLLAGCNRNEAPPAGSEQSMAAREVVTLSQSAESVYRYDFIEITLSVSKQVARNPFTEVAVFGRFGQVGQDSELAVSGFCDAPDGAVFRVRFMPVKSGDYAYSVTYRRGDFKRVFTGTFRAVEGKRQGILRIDTDYPWHFVFEGSGKHFFMNGTTAFLIMGWDDEQVIRDCIDRLHGFAINRIRVLLDGRTDHFWTEPIQPGNGFNACLNPWPAQHPSEVEDPGFDYTRFNCPYWQKFERMLSYAREREITVSVIFSWNDTKVHPVAGSADEQHYFAYAVARLGAYNNVTWDLGDDLDGFRNESWTHQAGMMLYRLDAYHHLATSHPIDNRHQDRGSAWFGMTSFQRWERPLHQWMLEQRDKQVKSNRIVPQVNEEYGYEDHYPPWAPFRPPAASSDANRRAAWEIAMAGCYQTTGETAKQGTGVPPDTGGGWVNGRGDSTMKMLEGYAHMVRFFNAFEWWKAEPHDDLVNNGAFCLAEPGRVYVVYLPHGGDVRLKLEQGRYQAKLFNPCNGEYSTAAGTNGSSWSSPTMPEQQDWVFLLSRDSAGSE